MSHLFSECDITLIETRSSAPSPGWRGRVLDSFVIQIRVVVHQVKVDSGFHNTLWLLPY